MAPLQEQGRPQRTDGVYGRAGLKLLVRGTGGSTPLCRPQQEPAQPAGRRLPCGTT